MSRFSQLLLTIAFLLLLVAACLALYELYEWIVSYGDGPVSLPYDCIPTQLGADGRPMGGSVSPPKVTQ